MFEEGRGCDGGCVISPAPVAPDRSGVDSVQISPVRDKAIAYDATEAGGPLD